NASGQALEINDSLAFLAQASPDGEPYGCRPTHNYNRSAPHGLEVRYDVNTNSLTLRDAGTREQILVIDDQLEGLTDTRLSTVSWLLDCRFLRVSFGRRRLQTMLYDMRTLERVLFIDGAIIRQFSMDPSGS